MRLPMGASNAPDIFQAKMGSLFQDLEHVRAYIDDLLIISCNTYEDHLDKLGKVLQRLQEKGLRINAPKSTFATDEIDYLGYTLTQCGIKPQEQKVSAILALLPPTNVKQLRRVLGIIQFYRDIWEKRTDLLAPHHRPRYDQQCLKTEQMQPSTTRPCPSTPRRDQEPWATNQQI